MTVGNGWWWVMPKNAERPPYEGPGACPFCGVECEFDALVDGSGALMWAEWCWPCGWDGGGVAPSTRVAQGGRRV
jgi:hypothetical protein